MINAVTDNPAHSPVRVGCRRPVSRLLAAIGLCWPLLLPAAELRASNLQPFEISYDVGNDFVRAGRAYVSLTPGNQRWTYSLKTKPSGVFKLTGKGRIEEETILEETPEADSWLLQPTRYRYRQDGEAKRNVDALFNWKTDTIDYQRGALVGQQPLENDTLDRFSVTLVVIDRLKSGFDTLDWRIFDDGETRTVRFTREGTETIDTELGALETIRVRRTNPGGSTRETLTWFAPGLDYLPVRIEQLRKGELVARMTVTHLHRPASDSSAESN